MNSSGQGVEREQGCVGGGFGQNCLGPSPSGCTYSSGWGLRVGDLSSAVSCPSASLASQAVLRGEQASCLLPLKTENLGQPRGSGVAPTSSPWQRLRLKHHLIKTPRAYSLSPDAFLYSFIGMSEITCRDGVSERFL